MKLNYLLSSLVVFNVFYTMTSCQQQDIDTEEKVVYSDSIYSIKNYKISRSPTVARNGIGLDIYHQGNAKLDTLFLNYNELPPYHPNNPTRTGHVINRYNSTTGDSVSFEYDLLFYNEMAYSLLSTGDYSSSGYPVIFMYTNPVDDAKSTKAVMIGQGIDVFNAFNTDSINAYKSKLKSDPLVDLSAIRTYINSSNANGSVLLQDNANALYSSLVIGKKFRPNTGGVFAAVESDELQKNLQPVFMVRTREGLYAKFMVLRFKGTGIDTQLLTLQWQALKY